MVMKKFRCLILVLIIAFQVGCGFKLRSSMNMPFVSIYINSEGFSFFDTELRRVLGSDNNVNLVSNIAESDVQLSILNEVRDKKILSLSKAGNVREFELYYQIFYKVTSDRLTGSRSPEEITVTRSLTYNDAKILAKEEEELVLFEEMQIDAVTQLLRRLVTVVLNPD